MDPTTDPLRPRRARFGERFEALSETARWIRCQRLWWAVPIVFFLFGLSFVLFLTSSSTLAPFFYAIF